MIQRRRAAPTPDASTPSSPPATPQNAAYQPLRKPPSPGRPPTFTPRANHVHTSSSANPGGFIGAGFGVHGPGGMNGNGFGPSGSSGNGTFNPLQMGGTSGLGQYVDEHETGHVAQRAFKHARAGFRDMTQLKRSLSLVWE